MVVRGFQITVFVRVTDGIIVINVKILSHATCLSPDGGWCSHLRHEESDGGDGLPNQLHSLVVLNAFQADPVDGNQSIPGLDLARSVRGTILQHRFHKYTKVKAAGGLPTNDGDADALVTFLWQSHLKDVSAQRGLCGGKVGTLAIVLRRLMRMRMMVWGYICTQENQLWTLSMAEKINKLVSKPLLKKCST